MLKRRVYIKLLVASMLTSVTLFGGSAFGQSTATKTEQQKEVATSAPKSLTPDGKVAPAPPRRDDLQNEVDALKAENAAVRELLRKMEEQQKVLLENVERLQRRLDGPATPEATAPPIDPPVAPAQPTDTENTVAHPAPTPDEQRRGGIYNDGIIIWESDEDARVPFQLKFTNTTQVRYLNTLSTNDTFTDHLGVVREVNKRNDITVNRSMFVFNGYVFDKRLRYNLTVWTSAGAASIVVAGNIGWQFNKALTITGGYTGVPGSRSLVNTFPFFTATDRTMADNFFRPSFTQGIWANGEPIKNVHYLAFVGNGLNTLNISATKIDTNLLLSGSVWWEPLGPYGPPSRARNMYDDYFSEDKLRVRFGTAFTRSREDRFSNLDQSSPENTSLHNSDGVLTFSTGAFAPGVTVQEALYKMWAIDGGAKWRGFAVNGQYYFRWLSDFEADGPLPIAATFDHGFELSAGTFVVPRKLMLYVRGSAVYGQFRDSHEYAGGLKWHFLPTERIWLNAELMR
ncbi:MAG TPA: hypothetical protein VFM63_08945, partial [Pyrinomonadaceae bacterium]|nr:hypothetical protein [Pyrinomonadaceae bacterium]